MRTFAMVVSGFSVPTFTKRVTCSPSARAVSVSFTQTPDSKFMDTDDPSASSRTFSESWSEWADHFTDYIREQHHRYADLEQRAQRLAGGQSGHAENGELGRGGHLREHVDGRDQRGNRDDFVEARRRLQGHAQHGETELVVAMSDGVQLIDQVKEEEQARERKQDEDEREIDLTREIPFVNAHCVRPPSSG